MEDAYSEVVHWQKNTFIVPFGKAGKGFVFKLSRLLRAYADGSAFEPVALKACTVLSVLLIQKLFIVQNKRIIWPAWRDVCSVGGKGTSQSCYGRDVHFSQG